MNSLIVASIAIIGLATLAAPASGAEFGPSNPFYAPSKLPFQAPPFDKIKDEDYQPAIEAGMVEQRKEIQAIADNPAAPTFENTFVAMEKSGQLLSRSAATFFAVVSANTNPTLQKVRQAEAPKLAAHQDAIYLDPKLFQRVATVYKERQSLKLNPEQLRLVERTYEEFVHAGANLSEADKTELKKLNEELATLSNTFSNKLLAATKDAAFVTTDKTALSGLSDAEISAAAEAAKGRKVEGFVLPLQNTTQQPDLVTMTKPVDAAGNLRELVGTRREGRWQRYARDDREDCAAKGTERQAAGVPEFRGLEGRRPDGEDAGSGVEVHG